MTELRGGIVGVGFIAQRKHIPAMLKEPRIALVAVADPDVDRVRGLVPSNCRVYASHQEMFDQERLDCATICTPPRLHLPVAVAAAKAGVHLLIEKPLADSVPACKEIIRQVNEAQVKSAVAHSNLFHSPFLRARGMAERGELGTIQGMQIFLSTPKDYMTSKPDHWAHHLPGGLIGESGPHAVYMASPFIGRVLEVDVQARRHLDLPWLQFDDYRIGLVGERGTCDIRSIYTTDDWAADVIVWGSKGIVRLDLELMTSIRHRRSSLEPTSLAIGGLRQAGAYLAGLMRTSFRVASRTQRSSHEILLKGFVDSIVEDQSSPVSLEEGYEAVRVMEMIVAKLSEGGPLLSSEETHQ